MGIHAAPSTESVARKVKRPTRVTATHSFLYEFDPFRNSKSDTSNVKPGLQSSYNIGQGDSVYKSLNVKQNSSNGQLHPTAALPKLQSRCDSAPNKLEKQEDATVYNKNTNLPIIKKQEAKADQGLTMDRTEKRRRNPISEVDRDIEKVKSDWRTLRNNSGFTRGRNLVPGSRSKQLYDTLDKMTREIDKIQKSYLDPKSNQYLQRIATKALNDSQSPFEEKVDKIKNVLFPKGNPHEKFIGKKIVDEISNNGSNNTLKNTPMRGMYASKLETRSLLSVKNACKSGGSLSSNFKKGNLNEVPSKSTKQMSSDIEQYLEDYISDAERNFMRNEELKPEELFSSSDDVAEMLKRLNIQSFDMYDIANDNDDSGKNSPLESAERTKNYNIKNYTIKNTGVENSTQAIMDGEARSVKIINEPSVKYSFPKKDDRLIQDNNVSCFNTSIQTGTESALKDNPFLEMGLHALDTNLSRNALSRVLRSEYLRKDASLKPM
ncbi:uncharacterized protein LOC143342819 [Colletes latitarsis]|uniref:uncharacterized protein LOC143342819 n=1 Tax=Colletes latitarsis TaxID=2605962 RepID=UPI004036F042